MAEIDRIAPPAVSAIERRASQADSIAALAQAAGGDPPRNVELGGVRVQTDRVAVASGARFTQQIAELRQAAANASEGASLLDAADAGLSKIETNLNRMHELAQTAGLTPVTRDDGLTYTPTELSAEERSILQSEFTKLRDEIDSTAASTSFNGTQLLAGDPDSSGDPLELSIQSGGIPAQTITFSIAESDTEALYSDLVTASLMSETGGDAAEVAVEEALGAIGDRQAAIRGARAQLNSVETAAGEVSTVVEGVRDMRVSPEKVVNLSQVVAAQVGEQGGVHLAEGAEKLLQEVLLRVSSATANGGPATGGDAIEEFGGKSSGAPAAAPLPSAGGGTDSSAASDSS
ncbi:MAG: flagellin [Alphaproteobacteria bacterium]